jgi:NifU-like protein involved in Fe-S cluster formation
MRTSPAVDERMRDLRFAGALDASEPSVGAGAVDSIDHGVLLRFWVAIDRDRVVEARFKAFGCSSTLACASLLCEQARGLSIDEAKHVDRAALISLLALPEQKAYAADLAVEALAEAVRHWESKANG